MTDQEYFADEMDAEARMDELDSLGEQIREAYDCLIIDENYPYDMALETLAQMFHTDINTVENSL